MLMFTISDIRPVIFPLVHKGDGLDAIRLSHYGLSIQALQLNRTKSDWVTIRNTDES